MNLIPNTELRPKIKIDSSPLLNPGDAVFSCGSCFSENLQPYFQAGLFDYFQNPLGILYHSEPIWYMLHCMLNPGEMKKWELQKADDMYFSFHHHSVLNHSDKAVYQNQLHHQLDIGRQKLERSKLAILTLSSAFGYRVKGKSEVIGNCQKVPQSAFEKVLSSSEDISAHLIQSVDIIRQINPHVQIVFTVSPVRHIRDGWVANNRSKARVLEAVHQVCEQESCFYFPAYELVVDELRDYEFFTSDWVHPNAKAVAYVWSRFIESFATEDLLHFLNSWDKIYKGTQHRHFNPDSVAARNFTDGLKTKMESLAKEYTFLKDLPFFNQLKDNI